MANISSKDGCSLHPVCTLCTETECKYVLTRGASGLDKISRDKEMFKAWVGGTEPDKLAKTYGLKTDTIRSVLRNKLKESKY